MHINQFKTLSFILLLILSSTIGFIITSSIQNQGQGENIQQEMIPSAFERGKGHYSELLRDYWPTEQWRVALPETRGIESSKLHEILEFIENLNAAIDSVLIIREGDLIFERYPSGDSQQFTLHTLQSITKSVVSVLVGIAIHEGFIENVNQPVLKFFPNKKVANLDARKERVTMENLLTMTAGFEWDEWSYPLTDIENNNLAFLMNASDDAIQYILDQPMIHNPGEVWSYSSGASILLGAIIEEVTNSDLLDFARRYLFDQIGIGDVVWDKVPGGYYDTGRGLYMTARDIARFGFLMLNNGTWDSKEILSTDWIITATSTLHQPNSENPFYGYGYHWWSFPFYGIYYGWGYKEQKVYIVPEQDLVVVFTGNIPDEAYHPADSLLISYILPTVTNAIRPSSSPLSGIFTVSIMFVPLISLGLFFILKQYKYRRRS